MRSVNFNRYDLPFGTSRAHWFDVRRGDAAFFNNRESRGVILFDTDTPHTSAIEADVGWNAEYRSALLKM
jgi:hypothetical protein